MYLLEAYDDDLGQSLNNNKKVVKGDLFHLSSSSVYFLEISCLGVIPLLIICDV